MTRNEDNIYLPRALGNKYQGNRLAIFVSLLCRTTFEPQQFGDLSDPVPAGSVIFKSSSIGEGLCSRSTGLRILREFERDGYISIMFSRGWVIVTFINFDQYSTSEGAWLGVIQGGAS